MKKISILGSTGSIGCQTLEVIEHLEDFKVCSLSCGSNIELLKKQISKFQLEIVSVQNKIDVDKIKSEFPNLKVLYGEEGLEEISKNTDYDMLLVGTSGKIGLKPTLYAIERGKQIALANKETLVMAGDIVMKKARGKQVQILPIDSEHSAIFQCLQGNSIEEVEKIIITASGGPFLNTPIEKIENATVDEALNHPKWHMGKKITIDSATLMNKGLEVIEAHHLFNLAPDKIDVIVHPQSIIHSAVEFTDGSTIAQLGVPSMHIPIQYALTYPKRVSGIKSKSFNFLDSNLTFEPVDYDKFKCLKLAFESLKIGGSMSVVLNASNEIAVMKFLNNEIKFGDIKRIVENAMEHHKAIQNPTLEEIFEIDYKIRESLK